MTGENRKIGISSQHNKLAIN